MITSLYYEAPGLERNRALLVMLPGVGTEVAEFAGRGMVTALHERGLAVDIVATRPEPELYLDGGVADALHHAIIEPALAQGHVRTWLLGISLGAMGALLYASAYAANVQGLVLLAPFLGTQGTIAEIARTGGLASWSVTGSSAVKTERTILVWLQNFIVRLPSSPALYLGYGCDDRFAPGHRMLAEHLPDDYVVTAEGGHDWNTWLTLWLRILDKPSFVAELDPTVLQ